MSRLPRHNACAAERKCLSCQGTMFLFRRKRSPDLAEYDVLRPSRTQNDVLRLHPDSGKISLM